MAKNYKSLKIILLEFQQNNFNFNLKYPKRHRYTKNNLFPNIKIEYILYLFKLVKYDSVKMW